MKKFVGLRAKTYNYLKDNNDEGKKAKGTKNCVQEENLHFKIINTQLEAAQIENKIKHLEKNEIVLNSSKEDKKEFVKNNKLILKIQEKLRSETHNVFTEEIKKIALSSNDDKRTQLIDSIEL